MTVLRQFVSRAHRTPAGQKPAAGRTLAVRRGVDAPNRITASIAMPDGRSLTAATEANVSLDHSSTPWLSATLPAAMRWGCDLTIDGAVDAESLASASRAGAMIAEWFPRHFASVDISADASPPARQRSDGVGCFFSGGVDSFYAALEEIDRITHLIFVLGFDIRLDDDALASKALDAAREAAAELGKPLIEVRTTIRSSIGDVAGLPWGHVYHGPALAHVATALAPHVGTVIIPSTISPAGLEPWGSHPHLDPLWSSSAVTIEHSEFGVGRAGKTRRISSSPTAMKHLRVCWENRDGAFNCGRCPKCVRTHASLTICGAECATLPGPVDPDDIRHMFARMGDRLFLRDVLDDMHAHDVDMPDIESAIRHAIRKSYVLQYFTPSSLVNRPAPAE